MPAQPAAAGGTAAAAAPAQDNNQLWTIARMVGTFLAVQAVSKYGMEYFGFAPKSAPAAPAVEVNGTAGAESAVAANMSAPFGGATEATSAWETGTPFSALLYFSTLVDPLDVASEVKPTVVWDGLTFGGWKEVREEDLVLDVPDSVRSHNGSWYVDILLVKGGGDSPAGKDGADVAHHRKELTRWMPKRRVRKEKSLLAKDGEEEHKEEEVVEDKGARTILAHWARNLTVTVVSDAGEVNLAQMPPTATPFYNLLENADGEPILAADGKATYYPPIFPNDFWLLKENMAEINETTPTVPLRVTYQAIGHIKFNIFSSMTVSFEQASQQQGGGAEMDEVKRMLTETNPILLVTTVIVTILHMVFEFLAFSSDVSHWRKKDRDLVGVSLRTILTNCFVQLVILLYLHDSSEETSLMILFTQGIGLLIEAWKITKIVDIKVHKDDTSIIGYKVTFEDKHELSEDEKKTQEYDKLAFKIVSYFAIPLLIGYAIYSLNYKTHRSWYSFIVTTLAQAIYMFGFVQLIPQLIINYKLKSVAHMPMKAMVYKVLSTVVDDFFAFCIKMPWLHRLACFRDDAVFVVLLYQRWIYRIDYSRVNEYGQLDEAKAEEEKGGDDKGDAKDEKKGKKNPESKKNK
ncbi:Cleft lip and palate transmembrane protein 1 [Vanrija pseudolonga]|uniref:Cleft lip and palate transmembrane protein 1 n=1 Tax=Vanrija pseudolonga TaxID=143232 RepID=A0AAF1BKE2_9TREE|nr:Cleft lip and palate transmembrane protein 1 [Vanrija pseudolonga]